MDKQLLKSKEDFEWLSRHLKEEYGEKLYEPNSYPCMILYTVRDVPQGWDLIHDYSYLSDFQESP